MHLTQQSCPPGACRPPGAGTRPSNRKALIVRAAAELFFEQGYAKVSMSAIAAAVSIGPSALYRHFAGKQELLTAVVGQSVAATSEVIEEAKRTPQYRTLDGWLQSLAEIALDARPVGVLWQREARNLPVADRERLAESLRIIRGDLREVINGFYPEDAAWAPFLSGAVLSVCLSISYHHLQLPRGQFEQLMVTLVRDLLATDFPETSPSPRSAAHRDDQKTMPTKERLVSAAVQMFAADGYAAVGLDDIAQSVGIAGPSIYHHFDSKLDLLIEAVRRAAQDLQSGLAEAMKASADAESRLLQLLDSYIDVVAREPDLLALLVTELDHLDVESRTVALATQRQYLDRWVELIQGIQPGAERKAVRIRVHAAMTVINDYLRSKRGELNPAERIALNSAARMVLLGRRDFA